MAEDRYTRGGSRAGDRAPGVTHDQLAGLLSGLTGISILVVGSEGGAQAPQNATARFAN